MLEEERIAHQGRLESLIYSISKADTGIFDTDQIQAKTAELKEIYKNRFRHQYSALFPVIKSIYEDTRYDVETLLENLRLIREYVEKEHTASKQFDSLYLPLLKLMDHINLELARLGVFGTNERKLVRIDEAFNESR